MATMDTPMANHPLMAALESRDVSVRLAVALRAGCDPLPGYVGVLVERCGVEPDFFVRDMLSWALPTSSEGPRLRTQARHRPAGTPCRRACHLRQRSGRRQPRPGTTPRIRLRRPPRCRLSGVESFGVGFWLCQVDPDERCGHGGRGAVVEPFGVCVVVGLLGLVSLPPEGAPGAVVDLVR